MNEEDMLDRLTAAQEATNPNWDYASKVVTCRNSLLQNLLSLPEARKAFGDAVCAAALREMAERIDTFPVTEADFVEAARALAVKHGAFDGDTYENFPARMFPNAAKYALVCMLLIAVGGGSWFLYRNWSPVNWRSVEVNSLTPSLPGKSKSLVFSVPNSPETEQKLEAEISDLSQRKAAAPVATEREKAEIDRLRQQVENSIINLEALKRVYAEQPGGRSSNARPMSYIPGTVAPALLGYK
jgi:hypothetical protein